MDITFMHKRKHVEHSPKRNIPLYLRIHIQHYKRTDMIPIDNLE